MDSVAGVGVLVLLTAAIGVEHRYQVFRAGENEDVRLLPVTVLRQTLVGFVGDRGEREVPAKTERAVASAGVVGERGLRAEAGAPRAGINGNA